MTDEEEKEKDRERFRNLIFFRMYATNEEMGESMPWVIGIVVVFFILYFILR